MSGGLRIAQLEGLEPGLVVEWLYESVGTAAVLLALGALHRRDAQRQGETPECPGTHLGYAWLLGGAHRNAEPLEERLRARGGR